MTDIELLQACGEMLAGEHWHVQLAKMLDVSQSFVSQMSSGHKPVPMRQLERLERLLFGRELELGRLREALCKRTGAAHGR